MEYIYGALLLHKLGKEINEENLNRVLQASGAQIEESKVKSLVISIKDVDIDKELESAVVSANPIAETLKEEKKEKESSEEREEAAEGLASLFG
mgnify:FL=1